MTLDLQLSDSCPIFFESNRRYLHRILGHVADGWHRLITPSPTALQGLLGGELWGIYDVYITQDEKRGAYAKHIYAPMDCEGCNPQDLTAFLTEPVTLLVENAFTDGSFIRAVARRLRRGDVMLALDGPGARRSVKVHQAGGIGEIPKEALRLTGEGPNAVPGLPPRFILVADSDAYTPNTVGSAAKIVAREAGRLGVDCHIFSKRTIENYVPVETLQDYSDTHPDLKPAVVVLTSLSHAALDHYPMKNGLPPVVGESKGDESLYPAGTPREMGLGDFMGDLLTRHERHLSRQHLQRRDHGGDLGVLLDLIERNI